MLYHLDSGHRLKEGDIIALSEENNSVFGQNYTRKFRLYGVEDSLRNGCLNTPLEHLDAATFREYALEFFRLHHPTVKNLNLPSRLSSFFATGSIDDAIRYAKRSNYTKEIRIFEVHAEGGF